ELRDLARVVVRREQSLPHESEQLFSPALHPRERFPRDALVRIRFALAVERALQDRGDQLVVCELFSDELLQRSVDVDALERARSAYLPIRAAIRVQMLSAAAVHVVDRCSASADDHPARQMTDALLVRALLPPPLSSPLADDFLRAIPDLIRH